MTRIFLCSIALVCLLAACQPQATVSDLQPDASTAWPTFERSATSRSATLPTAIAATAAITASAGLTSTETLTATEAITTAAAISPTELACAFPEESTVDWVACNVLDGIRSRNLSALHGFMTDPFALGPQASEWQSLTPEEATAFIASDLLPADPSIEMPYTVDRAAFPTLGDIDLDGMFGPDENVATIVYSLGWGPTGKGGALLFFTQSELGAYAWRGLLYALGGFE